EIVDKGVDVLLQPDGGPARRFPLLETVAIGPFVLVRVDAKVHVPSVAREIEARLRDAPYALETPFEPPGDAPPPESAPETPHADGGEDLVEFELTAYPQ